MRLDKICRACLCEDDNMISMVEKNIFKKFLAFTDLPVQKETLNVPLNLCRSCEEKLNISCAFREKCSKSHQILLCHVNNAETLEIGCDQHADVEEPHLQWTATIKQEEVEEPIVITNNYNLQLIAAYDGEGVEEPHVETDNKFQWTATIKQEEIEAPIVTTNYNNLQLITTDQREDVTEPPVTMYNEQYSTLQKFSPHEVLQAIEKSKRYRYANTKCIYCKFVAVTFGSLSTHMSRIHKDLRENWCHLCNETYEDLTIHTEIRHSEDLTCTFCKEQFPQVVSLYSHLSRHSGVKLFTCRYCEKCLFSRSDLNRHLKIHKKPHSGPNKRGENLSLRNECLKSFLQPGHLVHYNKKHSDLPSATTYNNIFQSIATDEAEGCEKPPVTTDKNNLELIATDQREDVAEPPVTTDSKQYLKFQKFSPHEVLQAIETSKRYRHANTKCIYCKFVPVNFGMLSIHMLRIHKDLKQNWCRLCNETCEDLKIHKEIRHSEDLTCTFCKQKFPHETSLRAHLRRHSAMQLFRCRYCEKCFVSRVDLNEHLKIHKKPHSGSSERSEKLSLRSECRKSFMQRSHHSDLPSATTYNNIFQSIATDVKEGCEEPSVTIDHNNLQPITTDEQGDVTESSVTRFNKHYSTLQKFSPHEVLQVIEKSKRYRYANTNCIYCKFVAVTFGSLSTHMSRTHKDLRENWCHLCNETYEDLTVHTEIRHSEDLTCTFCKEQFLEVVSLYSHLSRHSGVKLFTCRYCEKCLFSRSDLNRHLKIHKKPHSGPNKRGKNLFLQSECGKSFMQRSHHSDLPTVTMYNNIFQSIATDEDEGCEEPPVTTDNIQIK